MLNIVRVNFVVFEFWERSATRYAASRTGLSQTVRTYLFEELYFIWFLHIASQCILHLRGLCMFLVARYHWDSSVKFGITAEEVGLLLGRSQTLEPIDMSRHNTSNTSLPSKVLRVQEFPDGSALFLVDYYKDGFGGQEPPNPNEAVSIKILTNDDNM